jgi:hypothetical protein
MFDKKTGGLSDLWLFEKSGSRLARMPTHAMRPHEWGIQSISSDFMYGPPGKDKSGPPPAAKDDTERAKTTATADFLRG